MAPSSPSYPGSPESSVASSGSALQIYVENAKGAVSAQLTEIIASNQGDYVFSKSLITLSYSESTALVKTGVSTDSGGTPTSLDTGEEFLKEVTLTFFEKELRKLFEQNELNTEKASIPKIVKDKVKRVVKDYLFGKDERNFHIIGSGASAVVLVTKAEAGLLDSAKGELIAVKQIPNYTYQLFGSIKGHTSEEKWTNVLKRWREIIAEMDLHSQAASLSEYVVPIYGYTFTQNPIIPKDKLPESFSPPSLFINIAMKWVPLSLVDVIAGYASGELKRRSPSLFRRQLMVQGLQALVLMHSHGIYHADIKPQNILVGIKSAADPSTSSRLSPSTGHSRIIYPFEGLCFMLTDFGIGKASMQKASKRTTVYTKRGFGNSRITHERVLSKGTPADFEKEDVQQLFCTLVHLAKNWTSTGAHADDELYTHMVRPLIHKMAQTSLSPPLTPVSIEDAQSPANLVGLTAFERELGYLIFGHSSSQQSSFIVSASNVLDYMLLRTPEGANVIATQ